jgi:hypothetical protein
MKRIFWLLIVLILCYPVVAQVGIHGMTRLIGRTYQDLTMADMPATQGGMQLYPGDGYITYCNDCKVPSTPGEACAAGGPGAEAHRIRGKWLCF